MECIIVNDGSINNADDVVCKCLKKGRRFKYIKKENGMQMIIYVSVDPTGKANKTYGDKEPLDFNFIQVQIGQ